MDAFIILYTLMRKMGEESTILILTEIEPPSYLNFVS